MNIEGVRREGRKKKKSNKYLGSSIGDGLVGGKNVSEWKRNEKRSGG